MRLPRVLGILVTAALLAASLSLWRSSATPATSAIRPQHGGELRAPIASPVRSFNPLVSDDTATATVSMLTQGSLVRVNRATFEIEPWLAERWETSADGRVFTVHLRSGALWSDGQPLTSNLRL